jgi:hypothetical protein
MNRTSKTLLLLIAIALFAVLCWRLKTKSKAELPEPPPAPTSAQRDAPEPGTTRAVPALTPRARLIAAETQVHATADSACAMPTPTVASGVDLDVPSVQAAFLHRPDVVSLVKGVRHIDTALRASDDPFAKAVAVWLDSPRTDDDTQDIPAPERLRLLGTMAASTTDPRIYALAIRTCSGSTDAACQALSMRRWAALDPGNAVPWLFLLNAAEQAADASGQQEAWFHVASSARFDERFYTQLQPILSAASDDPDDQRAAEVLSVMGIGMAAAQTINFGPLLKGCRDTAVADANRAQLCAKIADLLYEHSDAPTARMFGASITKRMAGDGRRSEQIAKEQQFWNANDVVAPQSCAELHSQLAFLHSLATRGSHGTFAAMTSAAASYVSYASQDGR